MILQSSDAKQETAIQSEATAKNGTMKHFVRRKNKYINTIFRDPLPPRVMTLEESRELFPNNPHVWLCDGKLLRLLDPENTTNSDLFQVYTTKKLVHNNKRINTRKKKF